MKLTGTIPLNFSLSASVSVSLPLSHTQNLSTLKMSGFFFFQSVSHIALAWEIVKMVSFSHQNIFFKPSSLFPQSFISNVFVCLTRSPFSLLWQQSHSFIVNNLSIPHLVGLSIMRPRLSQITEVSTCSSRGNQ